ncbi:MAG TPA: ATP synthase F0 subunit B [Desulfobacterales bacterium]|jgi:F-type H+-transporting ATPase subunit b|nr:ATP synthase F0 subunit B [Desulfobacterales bacterium]
MVSVDVSLFVQIVNFLVLIWVLNLVLYKPIRNILIQRKEKVLALQQGAATSLEEAKAREAAFDQGIKAARAKGLKEKESFLQEAGEEEKRIVGEINAKAQAELAAVREKISKDAEAVRVALQGEVEEYAKAIGQKILGRAI